MPCLSRQTYYGLLECIKASNKDITLKAHHIFYGNLQERQQIRLKRPQKGFGTEISNNV